jgi:hypothetical protein
MTQTSTTTTTFTRTEAKYLASKVIADLYQCSKRYDSPDVSRIPDYEAELVEMLVHGYVDTYEFGFKKGGARVMSWHYTVGADGGLHGDSNSGGLYAKADTAGATYFNFMAYSAKWFQLPEGDRAKFKATLPVDRTPGSAPVDGDGYWEVDHDYTAGGVSVERKSFRPRQ